jgi:hypothetical protein
MKPYSLEAWHRYREELASHPETQAAPLVEELVADAEGELLAIDDDDQDEDIDDIYQAWLDRSVGWSY